MIAREQAKPGYKETSLGQLPDDWNVRPLQDHATFRTGPFGTALHKSDYTFDGVPVVNPMHIVDGTIKPTRAMTVTETAASALSEFRLMPGDLVIGRRGDMGRCAVIRDNETGWLCGTGSMIIRPFQADPIFLQRVLSSPRAVAAIVDASVGTTMVNLNQGTLARLNIQCPPFHEQQSIAAVLDDVDALLAALDRLIAKKRDLKQATMQQLLAGRKRLSGFSSGWVNVEFGDVVAIRNAKSVATSMPRDTPCVELDSLSQGGGRLLRLSQSNAISSKFVFKRGDVLFGRLRAYLRKYWLATFDGICSTEVWPLVARDDRLDARFLHLLVQTDAFIETAAVSYGTHMPRSDWSVLRKHAVSLPPVDEQVAIAENLSDMDDDLLSLEARLAKTRTLKQAMMQELLSGRIRLV